MANSSELDAQAVVAFLDANPHFFEGREALLLGMSIQHKSGKAISLVERQLEVLRSRNTKLRHRINELIENGRANDKLFAASRKLTLALLDCNNTAQAIDLMYTEFSQGFGIQSTQIILFDHALNTRARLESYASAQTELKRILDTANEGFSGNLSEMEKQFLFAEKSKNIGSAAVSMIYDGDQHATQSKSSPTGIVAIGHSDANFYSSAMETTFLNHISGVLGKVLSRFCQS